MRDRASRLILYEKPAPPSRLILYETRLALPRLRWACYPHKSSRIFPVAEGVAHRAWSRFLLPAALRGNARLRAGSRGAPQEAAGVPGAPKEGRRVYPAQRVALHRARTARITRGVVSHLGERRHG